MSVYVDPLQTCVPNRRWTFCQVAHLTADSLEELHAFATMNLRLRREWFQDPAVVRCSLPHYDLTEGKRQQAVRMGAIELTREQAAERIRLARENAAGNPGTIIGATRSLFGAAIDAGRMR